VSVAGVSLVTNYRETFAAEIRAGGVDGLVKTLRAKNSTTTAAK
jgi:phospholipid transport system substrate-binding protein